MGETDNKVDCGLGCLIERHWHAILVGALISLAGLLLLYAARVTCLEHLAKRRRVRALFSPQERRVVPTVDNPVEDTGLALIPRCTAPVPRGPAPIRYLGEIERRALQDGRKRAGPAANGEERAQPPPGRRRGACTVATDRTRAQVSPALAKAMEDTQETRMRAAQPQLFVEPLMLRQRWRVRQEQSSAAVAAARRGSVVTGKGIFAPATRAASRSLPLARRVYWENETTLDCFSHPTRPSVASAWELVSQSDSCSCGSSGNSSSSSNDDEEGVAAEEAVVSGSRDSRDDAASKPAPSPKRKPKPPRPAPDPALLLLPRHCGRSFVYRNTQTKATFLHPVEVERRRLRRLRRATREQQAYLALEAAERERREAPAKARAERERSKAERRDAAMEARYQKAAAHAEEQAAAEEEAMEEWEKHTAEKRLAMEEAWGDMSFAKRLVEEAAYDANVTAKRAEHVARKEKRQAAIAVHAEQMAARRKAAEAAAAKRDAQAVKSAALRSERFARIAAAWRKEAMAQRQLDIHGVPFCVACRDGSDGEQKYVFWWPNRVALRAAQRRRHVEATRWLPLRAPKDGRVYWFNPITAETLSGPRIPQTTPCWAQEMDVVGHTFLEAPKDTTPDPFSEGTANALKRPRERLNQLPGIAYEEQRRTQWAAAASAASAASVAAAAVAACVSAARMADSAAWGAAEEAQVKARRKKREAVLRHAVSAALPGMNKRILRFIAHIGAENPTASAAELMESEMASLLVTGGACDSEEEAGPACAAVERCSLGWYEMQRRIDMQADELRRRLRELVDPAVVTADAADDEPLAADLAALAGDKSEAMLAVDAKHRARRRAQQCARGARIFPQVLARIQAVVLARWDVAAEVWMSNAEQLHAELSPALCGVTWGHCGGEAEVALLCARVDLLLQRISLAGAAARADEAAICEEVADLFEGLEETSMPAMEKVTAAIVKFRDIAPAELEKKIGRALIECDFVGSHTMADEYCEAAAGEDSLVVQQAAARQAALEVLAARIEIEELPLRSALQAQREEERRLGRVRTEDALSTAAASMAKGEAAAKSAPSLQAADAALRFVATARAAGERAAVEESRVSLPDATFQLFTASMQGVWPP